MFSNRSFQSQLIDDEIRKKKKLKDEPKIETPFQTAKDKARRYLVIFLETSSIHGLNHLVVSGRHPFEVFIWLIMVAISLFGTVYISRSTWLRYQSSPTVLSMDRDMFAWNTTFPSITICPDGNKIDPIKLKNYLDSSASTKEDKDEMENFINALAHANFTTFKNIPKYHGIPPDNYLQLLLNLSSKFNPTVNVGAMDIGIKMVPTVTEMGICYGINSKVAIYNSPEYRAQNRWDIVDLNSSTFFVHPLDGEVFAQIMNITSAYKAYIHGPLEVPDISTKYQYSIPNFYMKVYVTALTVYTAPEAAKLSIAQRRCRYPHENILKHNSVYTYTLCRMECRLRLCLKYCHCIPYFYRKIGDEKICDVEGMHCLGHHEEELFKLRDKNNKKIKCDCFPLCDDVNYVIQSNDLQKWILGTFFQWGIVTYPRMRYRRDVIFGFTDVLVAVGGMAGLFLGCSVLSFMEIAYFLTLRLLCYARRNKK